MSMQPRIQEMIDKFHRKMEKDPNMKKEVEPLSKTINIDLGSETYSMKLKNAQIYDFVPMLLQEADVTLTTTPENLQALIDGTLRPMRAFVLKKIQIKGKIDDLMFLKKFF
ncbi:MAG: SCP2 sterol-binding domain-containing protein [Thermoplasmata archaeon]|nr:SCP2 sterol-binding domain-containing protein [Thermoplasmata archaeon]